MSELVKCPRCNSEQITANKQGFNASKAAAGFFLTGGVGLLAGTLGANKVRVTCLACGHDWEAGKPGPAKDELNAPITAKGWLIVLFVLACFAATFYIIASNWK